MRLNPIPPRALRASLFLLMFGLSACAWTAPLESVMTNPLLADSRSWCIGRFVIDRPAHSRDRKSTRLNSSHQIISYSAFCLKNKNQKNSDNPETHPYGFHWCTSQVGQEKCHVRYSRHGQASG